MPGSDPRPPKSMGLQCTHCHYPIVKVLFAGSRKEPGRDPKTNKRPRWLHPRRKACQTVGRQYVIYYLFASLSRLWRLCGYFAAVPVYQDHFSTGDTLSLRIERIPTIFLRRTGLYRAIIGVLVNETSYTFLPLLEPAQRQIRRMRSKVLLLAGIGVVLAIVSACEAPLRTPTQKGAEVTQAPVPTNTTIKEVEAEPTTPATDTVAPSPTSTSTQSEPVTATPTAESVEPTAVPTDTEEPAPTPQPTATNSEPPATAPTESTMAAVPTLKPIGQPVITSPDYAVQVFLWGSPHVDRDLDLAKRAGFRWIKQSFEWRYIEPHEKEKLGWAEPDRLVEAINSRQLKLIARVDNQPAWARSDNLFPGIGPPDNLQDFADFLSALATRYRGKIHAYQIWNEPNLAREWANQPPDPKAYVEMLAVAHQAIKAADPSALVITAGLAPTTASGAIAMPDAEFVERMYASGLQGNYDLLGVHGAGFKAPPETSPEEIAENPLYNHGEPGAGRIYGFRHVEDIRQIMVRNGGAENRVAVLEFGWTVDNRPDSPYRWHAVSEQEKADYLVRAFEWARENWSPWIGMMSVIYISDPNWTEDNEQFYWSITGPDGSTRLSYEALARMPK